MLCFIIKRAFENLRGLELQLPAQQVLICWPNTFHNKNNQFNVLAGWCLSAIIIICLASQQRNQPSLFLPAAYFLEGHCWPYPPARQIQL